MAKTSTRSLLYKRAVFTDPTVELQPALEAALASNEADTADKRREQFTESDQLFRLINRTTHFSGSICGQFITFEPDRRQPRVTLAEGEKYYPLDSTDPGENRAFADEVFYFLIRGNDVVVSQTRSLRALEFTTHLAWLLTTHTPAVDSNVGVNLTDKPSDEVVERVRNTSVKAVRFQSQVYAGAEQGDEAEEVQVAQREAAKRFSLNGVSAEVIRSLIGPDAFDQLKFEDDLDEANLRLELALKFVRKTTEEGQRAIDYLADTFSHLEGVDYEINLKNGGKLTGEDIKLQTVKSVRYDQETGLLDESDLFKSMNDWLLHALIEQQGD